MLLFLFHIFLIIGEPNKIDWVLHFFYPDNKLMINIVGGVSNLPKRYPTIINAHPNKKRRVKVLVINYSVNLFKKGHLSVRGKKFKDNHVHSIVKKKRLNDEKLEREYPEMWSDFSLEVVEKTLVNMFEVLLHN